MQNSDDVGHSAAQWFRSLRIPPRAGAAIGCGGSRATRSSGLGWQYLPGWRGRTPAIPTARSTPGPPANAPTWSAPLHADLGLPPGGAGDVLDPRPGGDGIERLSAADLVGEPAR